MFLTPKNKSFPDSIGLQLQLKSIPKLVNDILVLLLMTFDGETFRYLEWFSILCYVIVCFHAYIIRKT